MYFKNDVYYLRQVASSYLDVPRLHFSGKFRADVNTRNNEDCNFDLNNTLFPPQEWNYAGTEEFEFFDTKITSVIDKNGNKVTNSELIGAEIFTNEKKPFAKIVDLDVDFQVSSIYGLKIGLKHEGIVLFTGNWSPSVIVNDMWEKVKCTKVPPGDKLLGVQSTTKIVDIAWSNSLLIGELWSECQKRSGKLHVSITLDSFSCDAFTIGKVYGTIGIADNKDPLCVGGERKMEPVDVQRKFSFDEDHPCSQYPQVNQTPWVYDAPFKFDLNRKVLVVDLSNALPTHFTSIDYERITAPLDLGHLHLGYMLDYQIRPLGSNIPYLRKDMWKQSGIVELPITDEDDINNLQNCPLVMFTEINTTGPLSFDAYYILFHTGVHVTLLLKEKEFFVRPMGYYMARLQHSSQLVYSGNSFITDNHEFTLLVTQFGKPVNDTSVTLANSYNQFGNNYFPYPYNVVKYDSISKKTNETGHVSFKFTLEEKIPIKRYFTVNPNCTKKDALSETKPVLINNTYYYVLPIDGQVYNFYYCVHETCNLPTENVLFKALLSILAFSTVSYDINYKPNWEDDVKSIFEQQHHLVHAMRSILDMSNYTEVTLAYNIELLKNVLSTDSKEAFEMDPNYMPTTRNLSPAKRKMILKWLEKPCYNKTCVKPNLNPNNTDPPYFPRCLLHNISYGQDPQDQDPYFKKVISKEDFITAFKDTGHPPRPLFGLVAVRDQKIVRSFQKVDYQVLCNLTLLQQQLQQAVQIEFYTIPLYITSLYTIVDHHNKEAYKAIREVVMQEMLHFVQAANILIATGGRVMIDGPEFAPKYPATGLPGGVHPNLTVKLENYNLEHVHNTFMVIEMPEEHKHNLSNFSSLYTIGMFYEEIKFCIDTLGNDIFAEPNINKQVKWPWHNGLGTVYTIHDNKSAANGINEIIEQGEGANHLDPNQIDTGLYAHFYRFEELVCQNRLVKVDNNNSYAFTGAPIVYDKSWVYPMMENPSNKSFQPNSYCYTQARAFHRVYRELLQILQATFDGEPGRITEAVDLMESLQVHAKRCISTPYMATDYNCGPVWDYEWE